MSHNITSRITTLFVPAHSTPQLTISSTIQPEISEHSLVRDNAAAPYARTRRNEVRSRILASDWFGINLLIPHYNRYFAPKIPERARNQD
jgi:hypothetical protein